MNIQVNKIKIVIKILNVLQIGIITLLILGRIFKGINFIDIPLLLNSDTLLIFLVIVVIVNLSKAVGDLKILSQLKDQLKSQEDDIQNINQLNNALRAQRHDFLNHVQIMYTLIEMEEYKETMDYMDNLYDQIKQTGKFLKTSHPAINALISAKAIEAEQQNVTFVFDTNTNLKDIHIEVWELCRLLSNLIDNGIEATLKYPSKSYVRVRLENSDNNLTVKVENAGYPLEDDTIEKMFGAGYTTKKNKTNEHGMGLHIVKKIVDEHQGTIKVTSENYITTFTIILFK